MTANRRHCSSDNNKGNGIKTATAMDANLKLHCDFCWVVLQNAMYKLCKVFKNCQSWSTIRNRLIILIPIKNIK